MSLIWKHIVVYQILWFWLRIAKNRWRALLAFGSSVAVFCLLLLPFVRQSPAVVLYRFTIYMGIVGVYGISYILYSICPSCHDSVYLTPWLWLRNIFMVAMLTFSFLYRQKDLARGILVTILFFLCAVSGIGGQYFVLPIAFGALFPTKWFYLYSLVASLFLFGNWDELNIVALQTVNWNTVWMFVLLWFTSEMMISIPQLRTWYEKAINWSYRAQG